MPKGDRNIKYDSYKRRASAEAEAAAESSPEAVSFSIRLLKSFFTIVPRYVLSLTIPDISVSSKGNAIWVHWMA